MSEPCVLCGATDHERLTTAFGTFIACPKAPVDRPMVFNLSEVSHLTRSETAAMHAHCDAKERALDRWGYGPRYVEDHDPGDEDRT